MRLGQQQVSLGPTLEQYYRCSEHTSLTLFTAFDYFFPKKETRLFKTIKTAEEFDSDYSSTDETVACQNLEFLNKQAQDTLYPPCVCIKTRPGVVIKAAATFAWDWRFGQFALGYDFWCRTREKLYAPNLNFDFADGRLFSATQSKIFARLMLQKADDVRGWRAALRGEGTVHSRGIGKDYGIVLDFIVDFN